MSRSTVSGRRPEDWRRIREAASRTAAGPSDEALDEALDEIMSGELSSSRS
jgi:hypothetical protein